jgi:hypothetical protein
VRVQEDRGGGPFVKSSDELHEELAALYRQFRRHMPDDLREYAEAIWAEIEGAEIAEGLRA